MPHAEAGVVSGVLGGPPRSAVPDVSAVALPPAVADTSVGALDPTPLVAVAAFLFFFLVLAYHWRQTNE